MIYLNFCPGVVNTGIHTSHSYTRSFNLFCLPGLLQFKGQVLKDKKTKWTLHDELIISRQLTRCSLWEVVVIRRPFLVPIIRKLFVFTYGVYQLSTLYWIYKYIYITVHLVRSLSTCQITLKFKFLLSAPFSTLYFKRKGCLPALLFYLFWLLNLKGM